jgi:hypothetical protein
MHAIQPTHGTGLGRMLRAKATVQIADVLTDKDYPREHPLRKVAELRSVRTLLCVPMIKKDELIGAIAIYRREVRPFNDKQIASNVPWLGWGIRFVHGNFCSWIDRISPGPPL